MTLREQKGMGIPDPDVPNSGFAKTQRVDLGIAIMHALRKPSACYTIDDIAHWAGCTNGAILLIERRAIKKLANKMLFTGDAEFREMALEFLPFLQGCRDSVRQADNFVSGTRPAERLRRIASLKTSPAVHSLQSDRARTLGESFP